MNHTLDTCRFSSLDDGPLTGHAKATLPVEPDNRNRVAGPGWSLSGGSVQEPCSDLHEPSRTVEPRIVSAARLYGDLGPGGTVRRVPSAPAKVATQRSCPGDDVVGAIRNPRWRSVPGSAADQPGTADGGALGGVVPRRPGALGHRPPAAGRSAVGFRWRIRRTGAGLGR